MIKRKRPRWPFIRKRAGRSLNNGCVLKEIVDTHQGCRDCRVEGKIWTAIKGRNERWVSTLF